MTAPTLSTVYTPQEDTALLLDVLRNTAPHLVSEARVADLCTGSGVVAVETARLGARTVLAVDSSPAAVAAATARARAFPQVRVRRATVPDIGESDRFDLITCNPPYVPTPPACADVPTVDGPSHAWDGGIDGRDLLDVLCAKVIHLLADGGTFLLVQSDLADGAQSVAALRDSGLDASMVARRRIPFGPVLAARAEWLERESFIRAGERTEEIVVIRADRATPSEDSLS